MEIATGTNVEGNWNLYLIGDFQYLWRLNGLPSPGSAVFDIQANVTF